MYLLQGPSSRGWFPSSRLAFCRWCPATSPCSPASAWSSSARATCQPPAFSLLLSPLSPAFLSFSFPSAHPPALSVPFSARIALFSLSLIGFFGPAMARWLDRDVHLRSKSTQPGIWSGFLLGFAFAFGWTPCIG